MKFIDIQGFQFKGGKFVCKEIAIYDDAKQILEHRLVTLPICYEHLADEFKWQILWLTLNYHGLEWNTIDEYKSLSYEQLSTFVSNHIDVNDVIFVKGLEKKKWLEELLVDRCDFEIVDLFKEKCPNLKELKCKFGDNYKCCNKHLGKSKIQCAAQNVLMCNAWFKSIKYRICNIF